jgi:hypothetical protein
VTRLCVQFESQAIFANNQYSRLSAARAEQAFVEAFRLL